VVMALLLQTGYAWLLGAAILTEGRRVG